MNNEYDSKAAMAGMKSLAETPLDELPIAMAYVPMQKWRNVYEPDVALERGTLFSELDLPFIGEAAVDNER